MRFGSMALMTLLAVSECAFGATIVRCESVGFRDNYCPITTRGMSSSFTSATMRNGFGTPIR